MTTQLENFKTISDMTKTLESAVFVSFSTDVDYSEYQIFQDTDAQRLIYKVKMYKRTTYIEIVKLVDFDKEKDCWKTEGLRREIELDNKRGLKGFKEAIHNLAVKHNGEYYNRSFSHIYLK